MNRQIKGLIFDFDGTLVDSMQYWYTLGERYIRNKGLVPEKGMCDKVQSMTMKEFYTYVRQEYKIQGTDEEIREELDEVIMEFYQKEVELKPGVIEFLEKMQAQKIPMVIATLTERYLAEIAVERLGIGKYFKRMFTCEEVGKSKRYPDIYHESIAYLDIKIEEAYVFEDALYAIKTAKGAGFKVIAVYDERAKADSESIKILADQYVEKITQCEL